ncbi:hypothetical protein ACIA8O_24775 [Kitasatospora sp. NPDC051853]|uniref:hypothetical protein n=1 Tax=Kitasatospora sp. NPDC051853 TaxID=3364058 RepID=UPI0037A944F5
MSDPLLSFLLLYALGYLIGLQLEQLRPLLRCLTPSGAFAAVGIGYGPRIAGFRWRGVDWVVRLAPVSVHGPGYDLRTRSYVATVRGLAVAEVLAAAALARWFADGSASGFPLASGVVTVALYSLVRADLPGSLGHSLFRRRAVLAGPHLTTRAEVAADRALADGDLDRTRAELAREDRPTANGINTRAHLALTEGAWAEAERSADSGPPGGVHERITALTLRAVAVVGATEAGELSFVESLPRLTAVLREATEVLPAAVRWAPPFADLARWEGRTEEAVKLAEAVLRRLPFQPWRAEAECSYAAALLAVGRRAEAVAALGRAKAWCPSMARVAVLEQLVERSEVRG